MSFRIDEDEMAVLAGNNNSRLSHEAKLVYLLCIRPFMDYVTGMAGYKRVISYQSIREVLEYSPEQGSTEKPKRYEKDQVRSILRALERAGMIRWIRNPDRGLFFECLRADRVKRPENMSHPRATPEPPHTNHPNNSPNCDPMSHPSEPSNCAGFDGDDTPLKETDDPPHDPPVVNAQHWEKSHPPPVSGIRKEKDLSYERSKKKSPDEGDSAVDLLEKFGVTGQLAEDFVSLRRARRAVITVTAMLGFEREAEKAGISTADAVRIAVENGWQGFRADWNWQNKAPVATNQKPGLQPQRPGGFGNYERTQTARQTRVSNLHEWAEQLAARNVEGYGSVRPDGDQLPDEVAAFDGEWCVVGGRRG